ncbi:hypothetical protein scyTo_0023787 [Scyliorhinus torazame]|uniref:Uncharacterized protein n=1 Tax=Scyliorhinus torazame TaxID=75743 RepID=A0A401QBT7_SCYTO|nr:hypothetical protein [Scyliorhinus torazame]
MPYGLGAAKLKISAYEPINLPWVTVGEENSESQAITWHSKLKEVESKVNVPIHILNGDSALVTFTGIGYDKRALGNSAFFNDPSSYFGAPAIQRAPVLGQVRV